MAERSREVLLTQRPPITKTVVVRTDIGRAFDVFVRQLAAWWPFVPFSRGADRVRAVEVDEFVGGIVVEVWDDGTRRAWGDVLAWDPPNRFSMTWNITRPPTEVSLSFLPLGPGLTRVHLEHAGWERLSEAELGEDCALPGGYLGGSFETGWNQILGRYVEHVGGADRG